MRKERLKRLYWACFERQSYKGKDDVNYDCIEFNGWRIGVPMMQNQIEIQSDEDEFVLAYDIEEAIKLFTKKAVEKLGKKNQYGVVIEKVSSPWSMIEFPYCPHIKMEGLIPFCSVEGQNSPCAVTVRDGRCDSLNYPPKCPVCMVFEAYHGDHELRKKVGYTTESFEGTNYYTIKILKVINNQPKDSSGNPYININNIRITLVLNSNRKPGTNNWPGYDCLRIQAYKDPKKHDALHPGAEIPLDSTGGTAQSILDIIKSLNILHDIIIS